MKIISESSQGRLIVIHVHQDKRWLERLRVHLRPIERTGCIHCWDDTRIAAGTVWRDERTRLFAQATIAVVLVSADFLACDAIMNDEVPTLIEKAKQGMALLSVVVSPCLFQENLLSEFKPINSPDAPLMGLSRRRQEEVLASVAKTVVTMLGQTGQTPHTEGPSPNSDLVSRVQGDDAIGAQPLQGRGHPHSQAAPAVDAIGVIQGTPACGNNAETVHPSEYAEAIDKLLPALILLRELATPKSDSVPARVTPTPGTPRVQELESAVSTMLSRCTYLRTTRTPGRIDMVHAAGAAVASSTSGIMYEGALLVRAHELRLSGTSVPCVPREFSSILVNKAPPLFITSRCDIQSPCLMLQWFGLDTDSSILDINERMAAARQGTQQPLVQQLLLRTTAAFSDPERRIRIDAILLPCRKPREVETRYNQISRCVLRGAKVPYEILSGLDPLDRITLMAVAGRSHEAAEQASQLAMERAGDPDALRTAVLLAMHNADLCSDDPPALERAIHQSIIALQGLARTQRLMTWVQSRLARYKTRVPDAGRELAAAVVREFVARIDFLVVKAATTLPDSSVNAWRSEISALAVSAGVPA